MSGLSRKNIKKSYQGDISKDITAENEHAINTLFTTKLPFHANYLFGFTFLWHLIFGCCFGPTIFCFVQSNTKSYYGKTAHLSDLPSIREWQFIDQYIRKWQTKAINVLSLFVTTTYLYRNKKILKGNNITRWCFITGVISLNDIINLDKYIFLENHVYLDRK